MTPASLSPTLRSATFVVLSLVVTAASCGPPRVDLGETYAGVEGGAVFDHSAFDRLLAEHVDDDGLVDYAALAEQSAALDRYVESLAEARFDEMGRDERLALWINAYNAFTLRLILDYYPIDSIKSIPAADRWDAERWELPNGTVSLTRLEHEMIRPNFREPRIHFALVCAAIGCPVLRQEAYTGAALERQLEEQTRFTHSSDRWVRYERGADVIRLTRLYSWYGGDFEQVAGSVLDYVARYREDLAADLDAGHEPRIDYLDYDWSLNAQ